MIGVRSYGSSLRMQNIYDPEALPDTIPALKAFANKILNPKFSCVELDCGTRIGRRIAIPEIDAVGLINLETNLRIVEQDIFDALEAGIYNLRVRDTSTCISEGGNCAYCGDGYYARKGIENHMGVGIDYVLTASPRSYQEYISNTYSGSLIGFISLTSDQLSAPASKWEYITSHTEMNRLCRLLGPLKVNRDEAEYLFTIEDLLERALALIAIYGVYGNA